MKPYCNGSIHKSIIPVAFVLIAVSVFYVTAFGETQNERMSQNTLNQHFEKNTQSNTGMYSNFESILTVTRNKKKSEQITQNLFCSLSKFYRPSTQEDVVLGYIYGIVEFVNSSIWNGKLTAEHDPYGNLVIRVPAVGKKYKKEKLPPIALQSHTDMVVIVNPDNKDQLMYQLQTKGVSIEEKDGYYQSADCQTSMGADNGIGIALALRYLFDACLPHPALELVFTVEEEVGLQGASHFALPLQSPVMINLDEANTNTLCIGSLGAVRAGVKGSLSAVNVDVAQTRFMRIAVSKLKSGHSGTDIAKPRANAIKLIGYILKQLQKEGAFRIVSVQSGERDKNGVPMNLNSIASKFEMIIAFTKAAAPDVMKTENSIKSYLWENYIDERAGNSQTEVSAAVAVTSYEDSTINSALSEEVSTQIADVLSTTPNWVLTPDGTFPSGWRTSSNLGFFEIKPLTAERTYFDIAYMIRSYDPQDMSLKNSDIANQLTNIWKNIPGQDAVAYEISGYAPWLSSVDTWIVRLALSIPPFTKAEYAAGGLEPGIFLSNKSYCPNLKHAIAIGPEIIDAHSTTERLRIETIKTIQDGLQKLIVKIADAPEFKNSMTQE